MTDLNIFELSAPAKRGIELVDKGEFAAASKVFHDIYMNEPENALVISYLGLLKAIKEAKPRDGLNMCLQALHLEQEEPLIYLNLARVYIILDDRYQAVKVVHKGLKHRSPHRAKLQEFADMMGRRRKPTLQFLHRDHPVNIILGKLTWKLYRKRATIKKRKLGLG